MVHIIADTPELEKLLHDLVDTVQNNGGFLNDKMSLVARNGDLSIEATDLEARRPLIHITRNMLVDMGPIDLKIKNNAFVIDIKNSEKMDAIQRKLTEITFDLYNATNKVQFHKDNNFWMGMQEFPKTLAYILGGRTIGDRYTQLHEYTKKKFEGMNIDAYICEDFVKSRVLGFKDGKTGTQVQAIMSVIDFLNHHARGAHFNTQGNGKSKVKAGQINGVSVGTSQPLQGSKECFAYYRPMDPLDSFFNYGFVNTSSPTLRSIPMDIQIPNLGRISIKSRVDLINRKKMAKPVQDLKFFMPVISKNFDIMTASHLYVPGDNAPISMRRVLATLMVQLAGKALDPSYAMPLILDAEEQIITRNIEFYTGLAAQVEQDMTHAKTTGIEKTGMLAQAGVLVTRQLEILENYNRIRATLPTDKLARATA